MENEIDYRAFLLFGLNHLGIEVKEETEKMISLQNDYLIEIEGPSLFKLMHKGQVIAPFADVEELCYFLQQDIQLNYG